MAWVGGLMQMSPRTTMSAWCSSPPPGSGCSIQFGTNLTQAVPGSSQGSYLIVSDIESAVRASGSSWCKSE